MSLTNQERWNLILRDEPSPQSFKDFGFYFLISACLQRRVWSGGFDPNVQGSCLFAPIYTVLVGPPGCGKGRVINHVNHCMKYWRLDRSNGEIYSDELDTLAGKLEPRDGMPLYGRTPEDMSYQALLRRQANSTRPAIWAVCRKGQEKPKDTPEKYLSAPMYLVLDEMNLLFQKDSQRLCRYLLQAYDCVDVENETISRGRDIVKKPSLGLLAGTTPEDLKKQMTDEVVGNGLTSRIWFIYEMISGQRVWHTKPQDSEQKQAQQELLAHIQKLYFCYGRVNITQEADDYLREWWESADNRVITNNSPLMSSYYSRKGIHVRKLMTILLFAEQTDYYEAGIDLAKKAIEILAYPERKMHYALSPRGRNPLGMIADRIMDYLYRISFPVSSTELLSTDGGGFYNELNQAELTEVIRYLVGSNKVVLENGYIIPTKFYDRIKRASKNSKVVTIPIGSELNALPLDPDVVADANISNGV